ncbi:MAG: hypothetical protein U0797_28295 [Gemmataceae bacterium]
MPILDHFHPPLYPTHSWESFHMRWAAAIADALDQLLSPRFFAEVHTHLGTQVAFPDDLEVRILDERDDARLAGVVELVSPRNKDRPDARRGFAAKCAAYLQRGVGVVVADIVTSRQANLHNELIDVLRLDQAFRQGGNVTLTALAYRPAHQDAQDRIDVWAVPLTVGGTLPVMPLALWGAGPVVLDLEATYTETRKRCRL